MTAVTPASVDIETVNEAEPSAKSSAVAGMSRVGSFVCFQPDFGSSPTVERALLHDVAACRRDPGFTSGSRLAGKANGVFIDGVVIRRRAIDGFTARGDSTVQIAQQFSGFRWGLGGGAGRGRRAVQAFLPRRSYDIPAESAIRTASRSARLPALSSVTWSAVGLFASLTYVFVQVLGGPAMVPLNESVNVAW